MSTSGLPKVFANADTEYPDANNLNSNFGFLNFTAQNFLDNPSFELWENSLFTYWTLSGTGAAWTTAAAAKHLDRALNLQYGSAAAVASQSAPEYASMKSRKAILWAWVKTATPNQARLRVYDGVGSTDSDYHTGSGDWELLAVEHSVSATATELTAQLRVEVAGSADFDAVVFCDFYSARGFLYGPQREKLTKAWVKFAGASGTIEARMNITSVARNGTGDYTITWDKDFSSANYVITATALYSGACICVVTAQAAGTATVKTFTDAGAAVDPTSLMVQAVGDQ